MPWYGFTQNGVIDIPEPESSVSTGLIHMFVGTSTPDGYLLCDGSDVNITDYQDLYDHFTSLGVVFNPAPPPAGKFWLPNFSGRFPVGHSLSDATFGTIGGASGVGGLSTHSHAASGSPHTHTAPTHTHPRPAHTHTLSNHNHSIPSHGHGAGTISPAATAPVDNFTSVRNAAATTLLKTSKKNHDHSITGSVNPGPATTSAGPDNNTIVSSGSGTTTSMVTDSAGNQTSNSTAPSIGNDSIPPYYSLKYIVKT